MRKTSHSRNHDSCPPDIGVGGGHPKPSKTIPPCHTLICPRSESNTTDTCSADTSDDYVTLTQAHPIQNTSGSSDYTYAHQQTQGTGVPSMPGLKAISCGHSVDQEEVRYVSDPVGRHQEIKPNLDALTCSTAAWVTGLAEDHTLYSENGDSADSDDIDTSSTGRISLSDSSPENIAMLSLGWFHSKHNKSSIGNEDTLWDSLSTPSSTASPSSTPVAEFPSDFSQWTFKDREEYVANMRKTSNTTNPVRERGSVSTLLEGE